jgi:uncharacterized protein YyaL (SSP411 family)
MPGWPEVLVSVAKAFHEQPENVVKQGQQIVERIESRVMAFDDGRAPGAAESFDVATKAVMENFEPKHGGYGSAPKFPQPFVLSLLMQRAVALDDEKARAQVLFTLRKMAEGGMYDQLAGGFHRYSVDAEWLVPHFEKMLYDNALLPPIYLDAARLTGEPFYARIAEETLDYLVRELRTPEGAFYASTDADSEGIEGKYFVWSQAEVNEVLGEEAALFRAYYDVMPGGNFEGSTILNVASTVEKLAEQSKRSVDEVEAALAAGRAALLKRRAGRVPPATDTKVIVSWNGMVVDALARGGAV